MLPVMSASQSITQECKDIYKKVSMRKHAGAIFKYNDDGSELACEHAFDKKATFDEIKEKLPKLECR